MTAVSPHHQSAKHEPQGTRPLWQRTLRSGGLPPQVGRWIKHRMPRRLFARSLLIVILPMLALQGVVTFVFMDRHWRTVTSQLSAATVSDLAAVVALFDTLPPTAPASGSVQERRSQLITIAQTHLFRRAEFLPGATLPPPQPKPAFSLLDRTLSQQISQTIGRPFRVDTGVGEKDVAISIKLDDGVLRVVTRRSQTYAVNSHITLVWMVGTASIALVIAILFLRNQIRPIQRLAQVAEDFGKGRPERPFRPRGATEVRQAARAFIEMRRRIERQLEQRTTMLAGVSHDLRTLLTRFRLEVAMMPSEVETAALIKDIDAMEAMLEDYIAFARDESEETPRPVDVVAMLTEIATEAERRGTEITIQQTGNGPLEAKPTALKRALTNLVINAAAAADRVAISVHQGEEWVMILIDDTGPGIPKEHREAVFRPFLRLDDARNQDRPGSGLGLAIARDAIRRHGGELTLEESPMGGLRAQARLPR